MSRWLGYLSLTLWSTWLFAAQGALASRWAEGGWVPDAGVVVLAAIAGRMRANAALVAALWVSLARSALSADAWPALVLVYGVFVIVVRGVHGLLDGERVFLRGVLCALGAALLAVWLPWAGSRAAGLGESLPAAPLSLWNFVLANALAGAAFAPLIRALPAMAVLWREERAWELAARGR